VGNAATLVEVAAIRVGQLTGLPVVVGVWFGWTVATANLHCRCA
jgi:hypothetical protein